MFDNFIAPNAQEDVFGSMWCRAKVRSCSIPEITCPNPVEGMYVCRFLVNCVGSGLCEELIKSSQEHNRCVCVCICVYVCVCKLVTSTTRRPTPELACSP